MEKTKKFDFKEVLKQNYCYVISVLLIIVVNLVVFSLKGCWPFGGKTILRGDFVEQLWPLISELRRKILSGECLQYSFHAGMGINYLSHMGYGLLNPFSILLVLVPYNQMQQAANILYIIIQCCMAASVILYLTNRPVNPYKPDNWNLVLFSVAYAMSSYALSYMDIWYYDCCAIVFPIVILGLERMVMGKGCLLYYISLVFAVICNSYLAGLLCIFIILYYFTLHFESVRVFLKTSAKVLLISVLAIMSGAIVLLPMLQQLSLNTQTVNRFDKSLGFWISSVTDVIGSFYAFNKLNFQGSAIDAYSENYLYFGILPLIFSMIYFFTAKAKVIERIRKGIVLLIYVAAFLVNGLYYMMHLCHYPNFYPNRIAVFFVLYSIILASHAVQRLGKMKAEKIVAWKTVVPCSVIVVTFLCAIIFGKETVIMVGVINLALILIYMICLLILPYKKKRLLQVLAIAGTIEVCVSAGFGMFHKELPEADVADGKMQIDISELPEKKGFSKVISGDVFPTINQGLLYGYNDISVFSSAMTLQEDFYDNIGLERNVNSLRGIGENPVIYSLLNIQYMITDLKNGYDERSDVLFTDNRAVYEDYSLVKDGEYQVYENETVLPLGYMVPDGITGFELHKYSDDIGENVVADNLNEWMYLISGKILYNKAYAELEDAVLYEDENYSVLALSYKVSEYGDYYIEIEDNMCRIGYVDDGDVFTAYYDVYDSGRDLSGILESVDIYLFDSAEWMEAVGNLNQGGLIIDSYSDNSISGQLHVAEDGVLFTSIPFDENWTVYVDGEKVETIALLDHTFMGVELSQGEHEIYMVYRQRAVMIGMFISIGSICLMVLYLFIEKRRKMMV